MAFEEEGSYEAFTPKDDSPEEKARVAKNLAEEASYITEPNPVINDGLKMRAGNLKPNLTARRIEARKTLHTPSQFVTLCWKELDQLQKGLVAALFNNQAFPLEDENQMRDGMSGLWSEVIIHHPIFEQETHPLACWDAIAEVTDSGVLEVSGAEGPSGVGIYHKVYMPLDVMISVSAKVGR